MTEKITKEIFESWLQKHDWLLVGEDAGPGGRQARYLAPSGQELILLFNLAGELAATARNPIPVQVIQPPTLGGMPGMFLGKQ